MFNAFLRIIPNYLKYFIQPCMTTKAYIFLQSIFHLNMKYFILKILHVPLKINTYTRKHISKFHLKIQIYHFILFMEKLFKIFVEI